MQYYEISKFLHFFRQSQVKFNDGKVHSLVKSKFQNNQAISILIGGLKCLSFLGDICRVKNFHGSHVLKVQLNSYEKNNFKKFALLFQ